MVRRYTYVSRVNHSQASRRRGSYPTYGQLLTPSRLATVSAPYELCIVLHIPQIYTGYSQCTNFAFQDASQICGTSSDVTKRCNLSIFVVGQIH